MSMQRHHLSKKDKRELEERLRHIYPLPLRDLPVEYCKCGELELYIVEGQPAFAIKGGKLIPHMKLLLSSFDKIALPRVYVDRGASQAILRGADLMVPGIRRVEGSFKPGDLVVIVDEQLGKPVAVGEALIDSTDIVNQAVKKGKAVRNLHYVGDELWNVKL